MGQWSDLPINLLEVIEDNLVLYVDKVRIRAICLSWNSYLPNMPNNKTGKFTWLLQALDDNKGDASHALFNPIEKKLYLVELPEAREKLFKGYSHGWLVTAEDKHSTTPTHIYLINPITRDKIKLPPRNKFPDVRKYRSDKVEQEYSLFIGDNGMYQFVDSYEVNLSFTRKFVLTSDPSKNDCVAVAIYGGYDRLGFCRCNKDKKWRPLVIDKCCDDREIGFADIIFFKGKLLALNRMGELVLFESIGTGPTSKVTFITSDVDFDGVKTLSLVISSDGRSLIMVARYFEFFRANGGEHAAVPSTTSFRVFKLDVANSCWAEVKNIGNETLFLGLNSSFSISSGHFPEYKGNHIYFSDSFFSVVGKLYKQEDSDIGVYNLADGNIKSLPGLVSSHPKFLWPPPIWVNIV